VKKVKNEDIISEKNILSALLSNGKLGIDPEGQGQWD
jgi:hypothetical protein